jgi:uncharacterized protein YjbI with pentapeptide repeats
MVGNKRYWGDEPQIAEAEIAQERQEEEARIRARALKLWYEAGGPEGQSEDYWFAAIRQLQIEQHVARLRLWAILGVLALLGFAAREALFHRDRVQQAWQVVATADEAANRGDRIAALEYLNSGPARRQWGWLWWSQQDLAQLKAPSADLREIQLPKAQLKTANLRGAALVEANLAQANLQRIDLAQADLLRANLSGANLAIAQLQGTDLWDVNLAGARLQGANLQQAFLGGSNLQNVQLDGAQLQGAVLAGANLQGANLQGANLQSAAISGANLTGATLSGSNLKGARYTDSDSPEATCIYLHSTAPSMDVPVRCPTIFPDGKTAAETSFDIEAAGMLRASVP